MIAHTWKFSEVKEMHFTLSLISLCFIAIDGGPITTIPTEETNRDGFIEKCEYLNILMNAPYPVQKEIAKYFVTFNNSDLLSVAATCKSLSELTKRILNERIKPLIITN
uniref:F-box domain-containing protein n=1 Tax=Onchocerca volvulus TaxID=6282 RepID=A0A8R1XS81_ONCVO